MGQAQSSEEMPPDTFLPEKGLASGEVENGRWPGMGGLFGCDSATRSCCEKKIEQQDIRIAHNRPVIQQDSRQLDRRGVVPAPPPPWVPKSPEHEVDGLRSSPGSRPVSYGGNAKTQLWPPAAMTTPDLQRTRPPANPVPSIYRLDEEDSAGDRLSPDNVKHVETNPPAEAHFKELKRVFERREHKRDENPTPVGAARPQLPAWPTSLPRPEMQM